MGCEKSCYEAKIQGCNDIVVKAGLSANVPVYWIISKASSSNIYQRLTNTNGEGELLIPKSMLPAGFLVKGNHYKIQVRNGTDYLQPVTLTFDGKQYSCVMVEIVNIDRDNEDGSKVNVIGTTEAIIL